MSQVRRGTVLSFSSSAWTASVMLDGADAESTIPVGQWVPATQMVANAEVAVLVFGTQSTDTDDGVVLGAYGAVGTGDTPTFAALNLGSATGAASGGLNMSGGLNVGTHTGAVAGSGGFKSGGNTTLRLDSGAGNIATVIITDNGTDKWYVGKADATHFHIVDVVGGGVNLVTLTTSGGMQLGVGVTGGDKGAGTLNLGGNLYRNGTQVVTTRQTGWTAPTATLSRTAITNADTLAQTISHLAALVTDLTTHGLIGP